MPKTGDTRRHCEVELTACNNLPQPPSLHLVFWGLRKIVACCQLYLAVPSCVTCFWHGIIPTSYFIFNDFCTCTTRDREKRRGSGTLAQYLLQSSRTLAPLPARTLARYLLEPSPSTLTWYQCMLPLAPNTC